jgi:hypothetical protein
MKKYLVIEEESRGEVVDVNVVESRYDISEFSGLLLEEELGNLGEGERESEYVKEFFGVLEVDESIYEVNLGEERGLMVYELKS